MAALAHVELQLVKLAQHIHNGSLRLGHKLGGLLSLAILLQALLQVLQVPLHHETSAESKHKRKNIQSQFSFHAHLDVVLIVLLGERNLQSAQQTLGTKQMKGERIETRRAYLLEAEGVDNVDDWRTQTHSYSLRNKSND